MYIIAGGSILSNYLTIGTPVTASVTGSPEPPSSYPDLYIHLPFIVNTNAAYTSSVSYDSVYAYPSSVTGSISTSAGSVTGSYSFDCGYNDVIRFDDVDLGNRFTISMWYRTSNTTGHATLAMLGKKPIIENGIWSFQMWNYNDTYPTWRLYSRLYTTSLQSAFTSFTSVTNTWFHEAIVVDVESGSVDRYVNTVVGSNDWNLDVLVDNMTGSLYLGANPWNGVTGYYMDDLQIYKTALGQADINYLYANPGARTTSSIA